MDFIRNVFARKTKRMSCMPFLPTIMPPIRKVLMEFHLVNKPHGHSWRDVHAISEKSEYQPAKDDDDEVDVNNADMEVTCQLSDNDTFKEHVDARLLRKTRHIVYFELDFNRKADDLLVKLKVKQSKHQMDIQFRTHFLPSSEASSAAGEVHSFQARLTEDSMEEDFDNLLKTVAQQISKNTDIDRLGNVLGFKPLEIARYMKTNERYHTVLYLGTLSMLRDWRNGTKRSEERDKLKKALIMINHRRLADDLMNDDMAKITETPLPFGVPPQVEAAAAGEVSIHKARPTEESRAHFDDILKTVARQIRTNSDIDSLGGVLGFQPKEIERYIQTNEKYQTVTYMGTLSMIRDWRNRTSRSEEREQLKKALIAINHHRLADDVLYDDMKIDIPYPDAVAGAGEVSTSKVRPTEETWEHAFDDLLMTVAKRIHKESDTYSLGRELGFQHQEILRYIQTNEKTVTYMGTLSMIQDWRNRTTRSEEHEQLKKALIAINHHRLVDKLLNDDMPKISETSPGKRDSASPIPSASTSVEIPLQGASAAACGVSTSEARGHTNILRYSMVTSDDSTCGIEDGRDIDEQVEGNSEENANINNADNNSFFPLDPAVELQNEEVMEVPLATGAQPDTLNNEGNGALHDACFKGDLNATKLLINAGADVDVKSTNNSNPLLLAGEYGHQSCVEELISHGADPTKRDNDGDSLVHVASLGGRLETLKFVLGLEGMSELVSSKNNVGQIPLHSAAKEGKIDCVELLLAQDTRQEDGENSCSLIDEQDCLGKTPLHLAVEGGFSPVIEALIEAGADLNIQTNDGKTCLHLAVTLWGSPEHPDRKVQTTNGFEPVVSRYPQYEPLTDNEKLLLYLLDKGAICTKFDASGDTPIHCTNTHRLWQLVVSRIPEEKRNDLLDELDVESKRIKRTVQQVIGPEGGEIHLSRYGVHLTVPAGALDRDQNISIRLLETLPVPGIQGEEMVASFGVELKPGGLKFKHPAQIKLPHCASVVDITDVKVVLYHFRGALDRDQDISIRPLEILPVPGIQGEEMMAINLQKGGKIVTQEVTAGNLTEIAAYTVGEKELELYIDDFCYYWPFFTKPLKEREMICVPYSNIAPVGSANLRFYLANDLTGVEQDLADSATLHGAERIGDSKPFFVNDSNGDVHVTVMNNKREEEDESIRIEEIRSSNQSYIDFAELKTEHYEKLTMRVFQGKELRISCKNPLKKAHQRGAVKNVRVKRPTEESREQDFDDHLKTVAKKMHTEAEIDSLGKELGFEPEEIARYIQTNTKYQTVSYMGTLTMLRVWRNRTTRSEESEKMKKALIDINHHRLADDLLSDNMAKSPDRHCHPRLANDLLNDYMAKSSA